MFHFIENEVPIQKVEGFLSQLDNHQLYILREDLINPEISGNKLRKLKYNFQEALMLKKKGILSFGGAYSNHILALAAAGNLAGLPTIGIIRGEELVDKIKENPTLSKAQSLGMKLHFMSRSRYKEKDTPDFLKEIRNKFRDYLILPEGGTNSLAVKGCKEILNNNTSDFEYICVPLGTGGTIAGIIDASNNSQTVLGFSALKGTFQKNEIQKYTSKSNYKLLDDYCFGGYGKIDSKLVRFINDFKLKTQIQLDPLYTGKMMYGIFDLINQKKLNKNSRILAIHTGGLQGIEGMNNKLKKKQLPQIEI